MIVIAMSNQQNDAVRDNLEEYLDELPDLVADALEQWRTVTLEREKYEAILHAKIRSDWPEAKAGDIKSAINSDAGRYEVVLKEIKAEANHTRLLERLLCMKKRASLRTAF